ncbi:MAG: HAD hydrolase family protein [Saprospiraceae bacterium]
MKHIKNLIFDIDGVFTDGSVFITPDGDLLRTMNSKDGYAIRKAVKEGFNVIMISGGESESVRIRFDKLGVKHIYLGVSKKLAKFNEICEEFGFKAEESMYMGDDMLDIELLESVSLSVCPADASHFVIDICDFITENGGGNAAVREIVEKILLSQNKWL